MAESEKSFADYVSEYAASLEEELDKEEARAPVRTVAEDFRRLSGAVAQAERSMNKGFANAFARELRAADERRRDEIKALHQVQVMKEIRRVSQTQESREG